MKNLSVTYLNLCMSVLPEHKYLTIDNDVTIKVHAVCPFYDPVNGCYRSVGMVVYSQSVDVLKISYQ